MKTILLILSILFLVGCQNQEVISNSNRGMTPHVVWELIEIRDLNGQWASVPSERKHFLTFVDRETFEYSDSQNACTGYFAFDTPENAIPSERLTLKAPCMVTAEQLWWEHMIEERTQDIVITYPQLNPTALMTYERFKYKITVPDFDSN